MKKIILLLLILFFLFFLYIFVINNKNNLVNLDNIESDNSNNDSELISKTKIQNVSGIEFSIDWNFELSLFTDGLIKPRVMVFDDLGNLIVSDMGRGTIEWFEVNEDLKSVKPNHKTLISGLNSPHGLAMSKESKLYVAESNQINSFSYDSNKVELNNKKKILDLPGGGNHITRSILIGPDDKLYISIGSTCNVCVEKDLRRGSIWISDLDGGNYELYANGLRNSVFMVWNDDLKQLYATENSRDNLGDSIPPDEVNLISKGKFYGWPYCYGDNIFDASLNGGVTSDICKTSIKSFINIDAHSAPLGLMFIPNRVNWPAKFKNNLLVALHGSWNSTKPRGYKIVSYNLDENGNFNGITSDFITGFLPVDSRGGNKAGEDSYGRPVDLKFDHYGRLFFSDDKAGKIYVLELTSNK